MRNLFSLRNTTPTILLGIGLGLIASAVILSCGSIPRLNELNEYRASLADLRDRHYENTDAIAQLIDNESKLALEALELKEQARSPGCPQEEIDWLQTQIDNIDLQRERIDVQVRVVEAQGRTIEAGMSATEIRITMLEQTEGRLGRIVSLLLPIGILLFNCGLAVWLRNLQRQRTS